MNNARIRKPFWTAAATAAIAGVFALPVAAMADEGSGQAQGHQQAVAVVAQAAPTSEQLHPLGVSAQQQTFTPSAEQMANAKAIVEAGKAMGLPPRAWVIAVATSLTSARVGAGLASNSARADMIMPGLQYPHCAALSSKKDCWIGCRFPSASMPSMVRISCSLARIARIEQEWMALPSINTVQQPQ